MLPWMHGHSVRKPRKGQVDYLYDARVNIKLQYLLGEKDKMKIYFGSKVILSKHTYNHKIIVVIYEKIVSRISTI